jgi:hypothetical protein
MSGSSESVTRSIRELGRITQQLRIVGTAILVVTLINFGILLWIVAQAARPAYAEAQNLNSLPNIIFAMATIVALGIFETLRKRGNAIFQEVSDELQWHLGRTRDLDRPEERPFLDARVALRTFSAASELPLVPGRFSAAVYAALSLCIAVGSVVVR